jgi:hypothetical protein
MPFNYSIDGMVFIFGFNSFGKLIAGLGFRLGLTDNSSFQMVF